MRVPRIELSGPIYVELTVSHSAESRRYSLRLGQTFIMGRSKKVAIRLRHDALISRQHAAIELRPEGLFVTDLGSRNGTFLDGMQLAANQPVDITRATSLSVGEHTIQLRMVGLEPEERQDPTTRVGLPSLPSSEFEILGLIGVGATGMVYAAQQKLLRRKVAVKILNKDLAEDPQQRERFLREGWICSQIHSPHVVDIYDLRTLRGQVCMIMELVQGPSTLDRLKDGPLPLLEVVRIGEDVASALTAAQEVGVIHRDIKPSNILLDPRGMAKLTDFGIAKTGKFNASKLAKTPAEAFALTPRGGGLGTLAYVSPEQALDAAHVDVRTDIYSLGATLYHLLSGSPPFNPKSPAEVFECFEKEPVPLREMGIDSATPDALVELIHAMLSKAPEKRPHPPKVVVSALEAIRSQLSPEPGIVYETGEHTRPGGLAEER